MTPREAASLYLAQGWIPVPIAWGEKGPKGSGWPQAAVECAVRGDVSAFVDRCNVGVLLGESSRWLTDVDVDCPEALLFADVYLPRTLTFGRPSNPRSHRLYTSIGATHEAMTDGAGKTLIELRAGPAAHQTVFPPSMHPSGESIEFVEVEGVTDVGAETLRRAVRICAAGALLVRSWPAKGRHAAQLALMGALLRGGWTDDEAAVFHALVLDGAGCDPKTDATLDRTRERLDAGLGVTGWTSLLGAISASVVDRVRDWLGIETAPPTMTDVGNAERLVAGWSDRLRRVAGGGTWIAWDGSRWLPGDEAAATQAAIETAKGILGEVRAAEVKASMVSASEADLARPGRLLAWSQVSLGIGHVRATVALGGTYPSMIVAGEDLDSDPWLLGVTNGVVDLRTGMLRPPDPADLMTKRAGCAFDPGAVAPRWLKYLEECIPEADVRGFLQRWVGYCLTGDVREDALIFMHGKGKNGKSVFVDLIRKCMGEYAAPAARGLLVSARYDAHPAELMDLKGKRLVFATEIKEDLAWDEEKIKYLTGRDAIKARGMRENFVSFDPTHKFIVSGNHKPSVKGTDEGIWRRLRLVGWPTDFRGREDTGLTAALESELPGILAWGVAGALAWQERGLQEPESVKAATLAYRESEDVLGRFLSDETSPGGEVRASELYARYQMWCVKMGIRPQSSTKVGVYLADRGFWKRRSNGAVWMGIQIGTGAPGLQ